MLWSSLNYLVSVIKPLESSFSITQLRGKLHWHFSSSNRPRKETTKVSRLNATKSENSSLTKLRFPLGIDFDYTGYYQELLVLLKWFSSRKWSMPNTQWIVLCKKLPIKATCAPKLSLHALLGNLFLAWYKQFPP